MHSMTFHGQFSTFDSCDVIFAKHGELLDGASQKKLLDAGDVNISTL